MIRRLLAVLVAVPLLSTPAWSQAATTICKDGTTSAATGRGACTSHGGVDKSATKKVAATAAAEKKAQKKAAKAEKQAAAAVPTPAPAASRARVRATPAAASAAVVPTRPAPTAIPAPSAASPVRPAPVTRPAPATAARVPAPAASAAHASNTDPTGATAQCKDGTYSHATTHRGACSRHQGVAKWL